MAATLPRLLGIPIYGRLGLTGYTRCLRYTGRSMVQLLKYDPTIFKSSSPSTDNR